MSSYISIYDKYNFYNSKGFSGLKNLGNTCFINSVLQCLSHTTQLTHYLLTSKKKSTKIINNYVILLTEMWKKDTIIVPVSLKKTLDITLPKYSDYNQHDAHEFLIDLLYIFHNDTPMKEVQYDIDTNCSKHVKKSNKIWYDTLKKKSIISKLFFGQLMKEYICKDCNHKHRNFELFSNLFLYALKDDLCINDYLKYHFDRDYLYFPCDNCGNENSPRDVEHEVNSSIFKFPEIFIICIQRNKKDINKITKNLHNVHLDESLDFSDYSYISSYESVNYYLKSIICHIGSSTDSGHYFSVIKNEHDNTWTHFNDTKITKNYDISKLDLSTPYLLFYNRKK